MGAQASQVESDRQELTFAALELFDPMYPVDLFLERLSEGIGCDPAMWLVSADGKVSLVGSAGLSQASAAQTISGPLNEWAELALPYSELSRPMADRWCFDLGSKPGSDRRHGLVLCFESAAGLPRSVVEKLTWVVRAALSHRHLLESLKEAQDALLQRERLAALGELAAVVAHEVRNPLGAIFNCLRSLEKVHDPAETKPILQIVKEEAEQIDRIVRDLLDFAKPRSLALATESIELIIASGIEAAQRAQLWPFATDVELVSQPDVSEARVDADLMRQAVINLVTNALQAVAKGGRVTVKLGQEMAFGRHLLRVDVIDDGPGIPAEMAERIFEPFFSTKASGSGLGLSIVRRIVEAHQGELTVKSESKKGSTFTMRFPLEPMNG